MNKTIQTSQNTFNEWCHSKKKSRACWLSAWNIQGKSAKIERAVFQDESDFPLQIPINIQNDCVYFKGRKQDVPDKNLSHQTNRQSVKVMVSTALTWFRVAKPVLVNEKGLKVIAENYRKHLKKKLFPAINKI